MVPSFLNRGLNERLECIPISEGVWSSGYDSRFGCGRSRVRIPDRPFFFFILTLLLFSSIQTTILANLLLNFIRNSYSVDHPIDPSLLILFTARYRLDVVEGFDRLVVDNS